MSGTWVIAPTGPPPQPHYCPTPPLTEPSCLVVLGEDPDRRTDNTNVGAIWQCATCGQHWEAIGYGTHAYWARRTERQVRRIAKRRS